MMLNPDEALYHYNATITKVIDGDTVHLDVDLGFFVVLKDVTARLYGVNTPEIRGEQRDRGLFVKDTVTKELLGKAVTIKSFKGHDSDKYGRWLIYIFIDGQNYNTGLIARGLAVPFMD